MSQSQSGRSLNPATHNRLGGPLPRQLANRPRAHPPPRTLSRLPHAGEAECPVLPTLSRGYPGAGGRLPTCYSAVRHSIHGPKPVLTVRLACVRRAASVHPEPGSNSPFKCQPVNRLRFDSRVRPVAPIAVSLLGLTDHKEKELRACPCDTLSSTIFKICLSVWSASLRSRYPVLKVRPGRGRRCLRRCAARGSNIRRMRGRGKASTVPTQLGGRGRTHEIRGEAKASHHGHPFYLPICCEHQSSYGQHLPTI